MPKINDQRIVAIINELAEKTRKNYPEVLKMINDQEYAQKKCRDYSAKRLRKDRMKIRAFGYRMKKVSDSNYICVKI